jgi:acetyl-CoA carboxylase biotin carboxylase subunit
MMDAAAALTRSLPYEGAGTVEFVYAGGEFYFIEMNTRLQVEHPVTEMVTGVDLVAEQLGVAGGDLVSEEGTVEPTGHAMEFRINAEDPMRGFLPQAGTIEFYNAPGGPGVRVDSHLYPGYTVPPHYDSLLAKLIVYGRDREAAIRRGERALDELAITGPETTLPLHLAILEDEEFRHGGITTDFLEPTTSKCPTLAAHQAQPRAFVHDSDVLTFGSCHPMRRGTCWHVSSARGLKKKILGEIRRKNCFSVGWPAGAASTSSARTT